MLWERAEESHVDREKEGEVERTESRVVRREVRFLPMDEMVSFDGVGEDV